MNGGWHYLFHGVMTHWRKALDDGTLSQTSACEITSFNWFGDGTEADIERAKVIPKCRACKSKKGSQ